MAFYNNVRSGGHCLLETLQGVETPQQIKAEKTKRVQALLKSKSKQSKQLGEKLKSCRRTTPCHSAACPRCSHQYRQWSFAELYFLSRLYDQVKIMTVLFYSEMMTDQELFNYRFQRLFMRLRKQLERSGFTCPVVGYMEFDFHMESNLWLPHFHLMVLGDASDAIATFRTRFCLREKRETQVATISRPLFVSQLKDEGKQLSYLCKSYSSRIEVYEGTNGKRKTKKYRPRASQFRLSLRVMEKLGFTGRLFLYKARRMGSELKVSAVNEKMG